MNSQQSFDHSLNCAIGYTLTALKRGAPIEHERLRCALSLLHRARNARRAGLERLAIVCASGARVQLRAAVALRNARYVV